MFGHCIIQIEYLLVHENSIRNQVHIPEPKSYHVLHKLMEGYKVRTYTHQVVHILQTTPRSNSICHHKIESMDLSFAKYNSQRLYFALKGWDLDCPVFSSHLTFQEEEKNELTLLLPSLDQATWQCTRTHFLFLRGSRQRYVLFVLIGLCINDSYYFSLLDYVFFPPLEVNVFCKLLFKRFQVVLALE